MTEERPKSLNSPVLAAVVAGLLASLIVVVFVHLRFREYAYDDAYIHFRIARNLFEKGVPYYNPDERVMSSSSAGWIMLLYLMLSVSRGLGGLELPLLVAVVNSLALVGGGFVYTLLLMRAEGDTKLHLRHIAFFGIYLSIVMYASSGLMETSVALLIVGVGYLLLFSRNQHCFLFLAAAPFFRPELVVVLLAGLSYVAVAKPFSYRAAATQSLLGASPFATYSIWFFGTLIPHTLHAKLMVYSLSYSEVVSQIAQSWVPDLTALPIIPARGVVFLRCFYMLGTVAILCTVIFSAVRSRCRVSFSEARSWGAVDMLLLSWGASVLVAYLVARTLLFPWYLPLYLVPLAFLLFRGLSAVHSHRVRLGFTVLVAFLSSGHLLGTLQIMSAIANPVYYPSFLGGARVRHYLRLGEQLYREYPEARLMTSEIGALGYGFRGYILDGVGLASPEALKYHPMAVPAERASGRQGAIPVGFIRDQRPELIVSLDCFVGAFLESSASDEYVRLRYRLFLGDDLERTAVRSLWESEYLNVFVRRDICTVDHGCSLE